jgi:hypothetical protein
MTSLPLQIMCKLVCRCCVVRGLVVSCLMCVACSFACLKRRTSSSPAELTLEYGGKGRDSLPQEAQLPQQSPAIFSAEIGTRIFGTVTTAASQQSRQATGSCGGEKYPACRDLSTENSEIRRSRAWVWRKSSQLAAVQTWRAVCPNPLSLHPLLAFGQQAARCG